MDLLVWSRPGPVDPLLWRSLRTRILGWVAQPEDLGVPPGRLAPGTLGGGAGQDLGPSGMAHPGDPRNPVGGRAPPPLR